MEDVEMTQPTRNSMDRASINKLPNEVLAIIFYYCQPPQEDTTVSWLHWHSRKTRKRLLAPLVVAQVCRLWREVVENTAVFWTAIPCGLKNTEEVQKHVKYSRNASLQISVCCPSEVQPDTPFAAICPALERCRDLSLDLSAMNAESGIIFGCMPPEAGKLKKLALYLPWDEQPDAEGTLKMANFFDFCKAPVLEILHAYSMPFYWDAPMANLPSTTLTSLRIEYAKQEPYAGTCPLEVMVQIVKALPFLKELQLSHVLKNNDSIGALTGIPRTTLPELEKLRIEGALPSLVLPFINLFSYTSTIRVCLVIGTVDSDEAHFVAESLQNICPSWWDTPFHLDVEVNSARFCPLDPDGDIENPFLEVETGIMGTQILPICARLPPTNVSRLTLNDIAHHDNDWDEWVDFMPRMSNLKILHVRFMERNEDQIDEEYGYPIILHTLMEEDYTPSTSAQYEANHVMPLLEDILLTGVDFSVGDDDDARAQEGYRSFMEDFADALAARKMDGCPIKSVSIEGPFLLDRRGLQRLEEVVEVRRIPDENNELGTLIE